MLIDYLTQYQTAAYFILFLGMMIEGEVLLFTAGFLVHQGALSLDTVLLIAFLGTIVGDNVWYVLGELLDRKDNAVTRAIEKLVKPFDDHLRSNLGRTIGISKFAYGLYRPILLRIGILRLSFKEFIKYDLLASVIWITAIGGLGFLSSASFSLFKHYLRYTEITLGLGVVFFVIVSHVFSYFSKKRL